MVIDIVTTPDICSRPLLPLRVPGIKSVVGGRSGFGRRPTCLSVGQGRNLKVESTDVFRKTKSPRNLFCCKEIQIRERTTLKDGRTQNGNLTNESRLFTSIVPRSITRSLAILDRILSIVRAFLNGKRRVGEGGRGWR